MQNTATCCNALQHTAIHCNTLRHTATHYNTLQHTVTHWTMPYKRDEWLGPKHCTTLQHTAKHCKTLQNTTTRGNTLQHTATHCDTMQHTATHCNTLQHTARHCKTLNNAVHGRWVNGTKTLCQLFFASMRYQCIIWLRRSTSKPTVGHDSLICVTWLIHMCDMTRWYVWHDSLICVTWLIDMCDNTSIFVTWRRSTSNRGFSDNPRSPNCNTLQHISLVRHFPVCCSVLQCVAVCCSVL